MLRKFQSLKFKNRCQNCNSEEEFEYVGEEDIEFQCMKCGKIIKNEIVD